MGRVDVEDGPNAALEEAALVLWEAVEHLERLLKRRVGPWLRDAGLHSPLELVVCRLLLQRGPCRLTDLAQRMGLPASTLSELSERLKADGFLERRPHPADRRSAMLRATPRGAGVVRALRTAATRTLADALRGMPAAELDTVVRGLRLVASALARAGEGEGAAPEEPVGAPWEGGPAGT